MREQFLLKLADALRPLSDPIEIQRVAAATLGEHLAASRVHYFDVEDGPDGVVWAVPRDYHLPGLTSVVGRYRPAEFGERLHAELAAGRPLVISDISNATLDDEVLARFASLDVRALIALPLIKDGRHVAGLVVHQAAPRAWTPADLTTVEETGERTWAAVERARAEAALRRSEARFRSVAESGVVAIAFFDTSGAITDANDAFLRMVGYTRAELRAGQVRWDRLTPADWLPRTLQAVEAFRDTGRVEPYEKEYFRRNGERFWGLFAGRRIDGTEEGVAFVLDITERKRAEAALRESEEKLRRAVSIETVGVLFFGLDGRIIDANAALLRMTGRSLEELRLIPDWRELTPSEFRAATERAFTELVADGRTAPYEKQWIRKDGSRMWGLFAPTRVKGTGPGAECVEFVIDITRAKEAESKLRETDRRKDEFLAMLAHELRNPLAPIRTGLDLIRLAGDTPGSVERVRAMMERQIGHMVRLVDDLFDVSRISSGKIQLRREHTALDGLVNTAIEANRAAIARKHIALSVDLPPTPCVLDVDPTRFVQVVSNLLHNATKFTDPGGSIRIAARVARSDDGQQELRLSVIDTGIGISAELLPRVFDLFAQGESSQPGLGIGLALARRLLEMHGGAIEVRSDGSGRGSEFVVRLPLVAADLPTQA